MLDANGVEIPDTNTPAEIPTPTTEAPVTTPNLELPETKVVVIPAPVKTGNEFFDTVQAAIHEKGIDPAKYAAEFTATGAVTPESRQELVAALGEAQVKLIERGMAEEVQKVTGAQQAEAQKVFDAIGLPGVADGKQAFGILAEWSASNISAEERVELNEMLAKGGVQANLAVKALKDRYMSDPSYSASGTLLNGTTVPATQGPELISRTTYISELRVAERKRDKVAINKLHERAKHTMSTNQEAWRP